MLNSKVRIGTPLGVFIVLAAGILTPGCSGSKREAVTPEGSAVQGRLTAVHWLYTKYTDTKRRPPANAEELRVFGETLPPLEGGPVVLTEEFLLSPRDEQSIAIRYGVRLPPSPPPSEPGAGKVADGPVLAHEQQGAGGRRFVIYSGSGRIEEVDEARFKELVP